MGPVSIAMLIYQSVPSYRLKTGGIWEDSWKSLKIPKWLILYSFKTRGYLVFEEDEHLPTDTPTHSMYVWSYLQNGVWGKCREQIDQPHEVFGIITSEYKDIPLLQYPQDCIAQKKNWSRNLVLHGLFLKHFEWGKCHPKQHLSHRNYHFFTKVFSSCLLKDSSQHSHVWHI